MKEYNEDIEARLAMLEAVVEDNRSLICMLEEVIYDMRAHIPEGRLTNTRW